MKTFFILFAVFSLTPTQASETRPDCQRWSQELSALSADKHDEIVKHLKKHPAALPIKVEKNEKVEAEEALKTLLKHPGCTDLAYFSAAKTLLTDKKVRTSVKKDVIKEVFERGLQENEQSGTLIQLMLRIKLIEVAIEEKVIKVSDEAYFKFGSLRSQTEQLRNTLKETENESFWKCVDENNCKGSYAERVFAHIYKETKGAMLIQHEPAWWMKRVK